MRAVLCAVAMLLMAVSARAGNWKVPTTAKDLRNPVPTTTDNVRRAARLYAANCYQCHGHQGAGDGKTQRVDYDLRDVLASLTDGEIYWKITHGVGRMPSHAGVLTDEERWLSVNHLRALVSARQAAKQSQLRQPR